MSQAAPIELERPEGCFRLRLPDWGGWLSMVDAASRGDASTADVDVLLRRWLRATVEARWQDEEEFAPIKGIADLPAELADALVAEGAKALEAEAARLALQRSDDDDGTVRLQGDGIDLRLRPLSFAERNGALRRALSLQNGEAALDAALYEQLLVAQSTTQASDGARLSVQDLRALPLIVGEALVAAARQLSDPPAETELTAFAEAGQTHPDLELAALCLAYGISPAEAEALPAATARRLGAAARLLAASAPNPGKAQETSAPMPDNMTKIVVHDG
ncbi:MAG: hypothetical protein AAF674_06715 [Pseudomonadota bacterium]